ncbi:MAG: bifunctional (p)ppGpp synthetase/guanosine-3',5'-bis(diphosphate) 3'-pyrophosphohydrolase [Bacteroidetes bacterium]|uniref:Bifunctional (P)ppGpp synthetase/guanosine-3',5'-bis(Diphosphate) 3'-pyrophosphohydrolase n=1 Tax=Candidatus Cryptobacteroides intestinavium TaxID=2840766 RepID=A0A9D9HJ07_9BACT|nr:bifunctional (p)ppGpp synthetase/guanosine-3',5'-bis(diphosphate) 3'-pyrophosphohydrolase [Candidatus Cryptobacteroides intestinavium]
MDRIDELFPGFDAAGKEQIRTAYEIAGQYLSSQTRGNGLPFIEHPVGVAKIAADEIGLPAECIAAVFLHEAMRFQDSNDPASFLAAVQLNGSDRTEDGGRGMENRHSFQDIFGKDVLTMVDGLNKISTIKPKDTRLEAENYKKLIVSYSKDPRVTVLKLADRLEVMRNLEIFPKLSRERKILESLMLYIPLAHQLGLYNMKSEMEDIYFRFAEPEQYRAITNKLKSTERDRQRLTTQFIEPLKQKLSQAGISYKLKVRTKTAYSIWKKMQKQKVPFEGVYDVFAIRFIIDCEPDRKTEHDLCWKVFSYVTEEYESDTKRLRDWLSNPKPNGYESLHITVKNREGAYLEVQIRTRRMDEMAESGLASHWSYKGIKHEASLDSWLNSVRYTLEHPGETNGKYYEDELPAPPSKEIFVFTPSGELRKLSAGATVLDFAFDIHSNLGVKCTGARVNGKAVSIKEKLNTGDVVEIMSGRNQKPSADWLNFVVTSKAKARIRKHLSETEFKNAAEGRELLERRLKNWKLEISDDMLAAFMKKRAYKTLNAFYAAIGDGTLDIADIKDFILEHVPAKSSEDISTQQEKKAYGTGGGKSSDDILVIDAKNVRNLDYRMAKCCNPVFGDDVFGFVSIKDGIKIHRISCPNAARLMDRYPYRIQKVRWSDNPSSGSFQATLRVIAEHEASVINGIMEVVGTFRASVRSFNVSENERTGVYDITLKISVPSSLELDKVISQIRALKFVNKVTRQ